LASENSKTSFLQVDVCFMFFTDRCRVVMVNANMLPQFSTDHDLFVRKTNFLIVSNISKTFLRF